MHTSTRMLVCGWAERCHSVPSPLVGEGQGEGYNKHSICFASQVQHMQPAAVLGSVHGSKLSALCVVATPLPVPPPQGGREPWGAHLRNSRNAPAAHFQRCVHALARKRGRTELRGDSSSAHLALAALAAVSLAQRRRRLRRHAVVCRLLIGIG